MANDFKVVGNEGGGRSPGYNYGIDVLDRAYQEEKRLFDDAEDEHCKNLVREVAREIDPTHSLTIDVRPIEDFFEIRDKGGILGKKNVRIFFFVYKPKRKIVILGVVKKENEGQTPVAVKITMSRRKRLYLEAQTPES